MQKLPELSAPRFCPQCRAAGVIATFNGPTCTHAAPFFPPWWSELPIDPRRIEYLEKLNAPKQASLSNS